MYPKKIKETKSAQMKMKMNIGQKKKTQNYEPATAMATSGPFAAAA